jgi:hypothetical protein
VGAARLVDGGGRRSGASREKETGGRGDRGHGASGGGDRGVGPFWEEIGGVGGRERKEACGVPAVGTCGRPR